MSATPSPGPENRDIELWPMADAVSAIVATQITALQAIEAALPAIASAIEALGDRLRSGGRMAYAGAGSSGLIAQLDALELPGTFGIAPSRLPVLLAGGMASLQALDSAAEDDVEAAEAAIDALDLGPADGLVALAASGSTPFTLAALRRAKLCGALTVGIACRAGAPLLAACDHPILVATPAEVVSGSTRMAAGTAQKCVLNALSTGVAMRLGHVYRGLMVNMTPDNSKLRERAIGIVAAATAIDAGAAERALQAADWSIKVAILGCVAKVGSAEARTRIAASAGLLRQAMHTAGCG